MAGHPDPRQQPGSYPALLGGLHLRPALITHDGHQAGVQVAIRALGCRALFGLPAAELHALDVPAADVLGEATVAEVRDRLATAPDWPQRFAMLDEVLSRRLHEPAGPQITHACRRLLRGDVPVATVAGEIGWSGRYLTDRFRAEVGLRPKQAARVARFDRARRALSSPSRPAGIAADFHFADQSHLVREFRSLAGCTPSQWLAEEFGFVQYSPALTAHDERYD
ncbi:AraC family transcriptional regulator [Actinoplanes sp. TFC3]|uniref:helix-turn-helix domain-containing protein n=1 Tax=Actinoplanes sp. TFC3 TaxID=1710355 RepID=UPI000B074BB1|nr:AraC family transcriptional regulator [Actinoplanes sp. TFC3]